MTKLTFNNDCFCWRRCQNSRVGNTVIDLVIKWSKAMCCCSCRGYFGRISRDTQYNIFVRFKPPFQPQLRRQNAIRVRFGVDNSAAPSVELTTFGCFTVIKNTWVTEYLLQHHVYFQASFLDIIIITDITLSTMHLTYFQTMSSTSSPVLSQWVNLTVRKSHCIVHLLARK